MEARTALAWSHNCRGMAPGMLSVPSVRARPDAMLCAMGKCQERWTSSNRQSTALGSTGEGTPEMCG